MGKLSLWRQKWRHRGITGRFQSATGDGREKQIPHYLQFLLYSKYHNSLPVVPMDSRNSQWLRQSECTPGVPGKAGISKVVLCCMPDRHKQFFSQRSSVSRMLFAVVSVVPTVNSWQGPTCSKILMTCRVMAWEMMLKIKAWKFFADSTSPAYLSFSTWPRLSLIYIWNMRGFFPQILMSQGYACVHKPYVKERSSVFQVWKGNCSTVRHTSLASLSLRSQTW